MARARAASRATSVASLAVPWMTPPPRPGAPSAPTARNAGGRPSSLASQSSTICVQHCLLLAIYKSQQVLQSPGTHACMPET